MLTFFESLDLKFLSRYLILAHRDVAFALFIDVSIRLLNSTSCRHLRRRPFLSSRSPLLPPLAKNHIYLLSNKRFLVVPLIYASWIFSMSGCAP